MIRIEKPTISVTLAVTSLILLAICLGIIESSNLGLEYKSAEEKKLRLPITITGSQIKDFGDGSFSGSDALSPDEGSSPSQGPTEDLFGTETIPEEDNSRIGPEGGGGSSKGQIKPTHSECVKNELGVPECQIVVGEGPNTCVSNTDCVIQEAETESETGSRKKFCRDSDGDNPFEKGIVESELGKKLDSCSSRSNMIEYYCNPQRPTYLESRELDCAIYDTDQDDNIDEYSCSEGRCVKKDPSICFDSDNGLNYYLKGSVTTADGTIREDTCIGEGQSETTLQEYFCDRANNPGVSIKYCEGIGETCVEGACLPLRGSTIALPQTTKENTIVATITGFFTRTFTQ